MGVAGAGDRFSDILALGDLAVVAADVVVLDAVDAVDASEAPLQRRFVCRVRPDDVGPERCKGTRLFAVGIPRHRPNTPSLLKETSGDRAALEARSAHHRDRLAFLLAHRNPFAPTRGIVPTPKCAALATSTCRSTGHIVLAQASSNHDPGSYRPQRQ